jgi:hypothetical protein
MVHPNVFNRHLEKELEILTRPTNVVVSVFDKVITGGSADAYHEMLGFGKCDPNDVN